MEELLNFFSDNEVAIQITCDVGVKPTVHAMQKGHSMSDLIFADGDTVIEALENTKQKIFNDNVDSTQTKVVGRMLGLE